MFDVVKQSWPWYVSGALIGAVVPLLFVAGNKSFGVSAVFRQACAACFPANISYFKYNWKQDAWNLFFAMGIVVGGFIATTFLNAAQPTGIHPALAHSLAQNGITSYSGLVPEQLFSIHALLSVRGFIFLVVGGFLVGFGSRYAGGCTSGHVITGLSTLQWPSLVATICFLAGAFFMSNLLLPYILRLH